MLELKSIKKSYKTGDFIQHALKNVSLEFRANEFVAVLGPSGSGKTTLLNIIGGLDKYDQGDLIINNKSTKNFKDRDWDAYRNNCIGFVFQSYNLISHINILSNVEMGMTLSGVSSRERRKKALEVLDRVGLKDHVNKKPNQLSGGQMQRVAIARALANDPDIILADEPTGALDTKTSVQILELIKEIAKDKLVVMVTHNPELANKYANRVIDMRDGEIINDSNPVDAKKETKKDYIIKKTAMSFLTALKLSVNNIRTKKGRTLLTSLASSIGIIGIALILSLSNGFDKQIDQFEKSTLSNMPIIISEQAMSLDSMMGSTDTANLENFPDIDYIIPKESIQNQITHKNVISKNYVDYIDNLDGEAVSGISYYRLTALNLLNKIDGKVQKLDTSNISFGAIPKSLDNSKKTVVEELFDILAGREAKETNELVLGVDAQNTVDTNILKILGFDTKKDQISYEDIIGTKINIVLNDDLYQKLGNYFTFNSNLEDLYENKSMELEIVGIIRMKEDFPTYVQGSQLLYSDTLIDYIISENKSSEIVKAQRNANYNVLTGAMFQDESLNGVNEKENALAYLGDESTPYLIQVYPRNFEGKDKIIEALDKYNEGKPEEDKIIYTDQAEMISSLSGGIMSAITYVLVAFSSISLIVSSVMIGIIMYISVLERTKEIGILRSLGARKKDISRVFNAETLIIGFSSGLLGIIIAWLMLFPVNSILLSLTDLKNVAVMNPIHALTLVTISIILTLIGGWIPAKVASKKDPVIALRTE